MSLKADRLSTSEELKAQRVQCEEKFEAEIEQAGRIADTAEKILQLEKVRQDVSSDDWKEKNDIWSAASKVYKVGVKEQAIYWGIAIPTLAIGSIVYLTKHKKNENSFYDQLIKEAEDHFKNISDKETRLAEMIAAVLEDHVQEIAQSPLCVDVLNEPGLVKTFAVAAIKKGITIIQENPAAEETTVAEQKQPEPRQKRSYAKIANAVKPRA